jgi:AAA15 family ATPase/GTPase
MLETITIKNFKSIANDTIELGRVNVFIGENGCGKSNILEAVGFASAALENRVENEHLSSKGIRIAKPSLIISNFKGKKQANHFELNLVLQHEYQLDLNFTTDFRESFYEEWEVKGGARIKHNVVKEPQVEYGVSGRTKLQWTNEAGYVTENFPEKVIQNQMLRRFLIYSLNTPALRGLTHESKKEPVGINGEGLDIFLASFDQEELEKLKSYNYLIDWLDDFFIDVQDVLKFKGYKANRSGSALYFVDRHMPKNNNFFSLENANEGILHVLFYLALLISRRIPPYLAIDNIESCLNPHLCRHLMEEIGQLAKTQDKQLLITTHNPAILDGMNLLDDEIRLFEVKRNDKGHTHTRRITIKPERYNQMGERYKLSELWTRGYLGAIPHNF